MDRQPVATVGLVWSKENIDFFGRAEGEARTIVPYRGFMQALIRARIPYVPVHADHIDREAENLSLLALPNVGALSEEQCQAVTRFVGGGGGLIATGETSLYDVSGDRRPDFGLSDLFGAHATEEYRGSLVPPTQDWEEYSQHSYLRIDQAARPNDGPEDSIGQQTVFNGFDETDILPFGGRLEVVKIDASSSAPLTFIPPFPIFPPETSWMRQPDTSEAALVLNEAGSGRVAYLPANIDYCFGRYNLPDHGDLLANIVRWASKDDIPLKVTGAGLIDCHLYRQEERIILHLVNLTNAGTWRTPLHELIAVGPFQVKVQLPEGLATSSVKFLVAVEETKVSSAGNWVSFEISSITDHEVCVIS